MQRHAGGTHVQEGGDHVDRAKDRRGTGDVYGKDRQIHRPALFGGRKRRVENPAHTRAKLAVAAGADDGKHRQRRTRNVQPVAEVVHARERHIRRTNLQGHEIVTKTAKEGWDHNEEHHQDAVAGDQHIPKVAVRRTFGC